MLKALSKFNATALFLCVIFAYLLVKTVTLFSAYNVWDDAFIFVRYADNILRHGTVAFNSAHGPTYGLTSLGFLFVVIPFRLIFSNSPALTMISASSACGVAFICMIVAFFKKNSCCQNIYSYCDSTVSILLLTSFVFSMNMFAKHFVSGMDTTFAILYLSLYFFFKKHHDGRPSLVTAIFVGLCGGFAFSVRPDLMIFTVIVPLADVLFADKSYKRSLSVGILVITVIVTALQLLIYNLYFHSPLPLPFYCKGFRLYGDLIYFNYRYVPIIGLLEYILSNLILFIVIFISFLVNPKKWLAMLPPMYKGILAATIIFTLYYLFFVLQIMHMFSRFYYPTLPALCLLAAYSFYFIYNEASFISQINIIRTSKVFCGIMVLIFGVLIIAAFFNTSLRSKRFNFDILAIYKETSSNYWFCLDKFSQFPDELSIATTELGYPLAMNPHKIIIDLAGLNETQIAHDGFHSDTFFANYQPDLIYLPHPDYQDMIAKIEKSVYFKSNYDYYPASIISAKLGIAIKRNSPFYLKMKNLIEANRRK